jgi:hypothetical protein
MTLELVAIYKGKKGTHFLTNYVYGLFNATKSGKYPWIYNHFRTRVSRQTKNQIGNFVERLYLEVSV